MEEEPLTDALLRQFLLGQVDDEERQRIESLFITDPQVNERILVAERDLIENYLDNCLTTGDREKFLSQYAETPVQRRKLGIAKSINDWAREQSSVTQGSRFKTSAWSRFQARVRLKPVFVIPITVAIMIAIVVALVWVNQRREQRREQLAVEQELARLNAQSSLDEAPPQVIRLAPISFRSVEPQSEFIPRADIPILELSLVWMRKERYSSYRAVISPVGDDESFTIHELQTASVRDAIRIRLPTHILARGDYQILLSGIAADGSAGSTEEYRLTVGG